MPVHAWVYFSGSKSPKPTQRGWISPRSPPGFTNSRNFLSFCFQKYIQTCVYVRRVEYCLEPLKHVCRKTASTRPPKTLVSFRRHRSPVHLLTQAPETPVSHVPRGLLPVSSRGTPCEDHVPGAPTDPKPVAAPWLRASDAVPRTRDPSKFCAVSRFASAVHTGSGWPASPARRGRGRQRFPAPCVHVLPSPWCLCPHTGLCKGPSTALRLVSLQGSMCASAWPQTQMEM